MSEDSIMPGASEPQQIPDSVEECADQPEVLVDRRGLLGLSLKWSKAALAAILIGGVVGTEEEAEAASWANRRGGGGWGNAPGPGSWVNRRPGSWVNGPGGWVNRRRPRGRWNPPRGSWVNRPGGSWANRR